MRYAEMLKTGAALFGVMAVVWAGIVWLDIRPVLSRELKPVWSAIDSAQRGVQFINYQIYRQRSLSEVLTVQEQAEFCTIGEILKIQTDGCRR